MGAKETINGLLTFGYPGAPNIGKQINMLAGKMEVNAINPAGGFDINVGPFGSLTSSTMNTLGFSLSTLGRYSLDAKLKIDMSTLGPISISSSTIGSVTMENLLGTVQVGSIGKIAIKNKIGSLGAILDELMSALLQLNVPTGVGPSGPPINAPALTAIQLKLKAVLD